MTRKSSGKSETDMVVPAFMGIVVAFPGAEDPRVVEPGPAAFGTSIALAPRHPRGTVQGCGVVVGVINVRRPLPNVAEHIVKPKRVGFERSDGRGIGKSIGANEVQF